jgi:uncharacterized protein YecE (DUF72 family)
MNLYVGSSGYAYKEWKGKFYPDDLPASRMLSYYAEHFCAVEINGTFRQMPTAASLKAWTPQVPKGFKFVIKAPQRITHIKRLRDVDDTVRELLDATDVLGKHLGPLFFQLPPNFKKDLPRLRDFLSLLPRTTRAAFEFRHESWFDDDVYHLLRRQRAALCIADADDDLKVPFVATTNWGYLRLRRARYSRKQLKTWVDRVKDQAWREAFVFFKHEDEANAPRFAKQFIQLGE